DHAAKLLYPDAVDQELDPGAGAVGAEILLAVEDPQDRFGDLQVLAVVDARELPEGSADARHDRGAAAGPDLEALHLLAVDLADAGQEAEIVDVRDRDVLVRGREGDLELARQQLADLVSHEIAHERPRVGGEVEELALGHARPRVAGDVADRVAAGLAG